MCRKQKNCSEPAFNNSRKANVGTGLIFVAEGLASLYTDQGQSERAARLFAWTDVQRRTGGDLRPAVEQSSVERDLETIRSQLDETAFDQAWADGSAMTCGSGIGCCIG